jgi:hypothetical protein
MSASTSAVARAHDEWPLGYEPSRGLSISGSSFGSNRKGRGLA